MTIPELLQRLLELLGIKQSDNAKFQRLKEKLSTAKATNIDQVESLKEKIKTLERKALEKKREYDASKGDVKRVVGGEIERIFKELDRLKGRETILGQSLDKLSLAATKVEELIVAGQQGVDEYVFDGLAVDLEDVFVELKATDKAAQGLEEVAYEAPKSDQIDVESRLSELDSSKEASQEISQSTAQRLKELAGEEE